MSRPMTRTVARAGAVLSLLALAGGLAIMVAGTAIYGDWWLVRLPWSDLGMQLIAIGLAASLLFLAAEDVVEPVGRWRFIALPGIAVGAAIWAFLALVGLAAGGACCEQPSANLVTALYSAPGAIILLLAAVALTALPLAVSRPWGQTR